MNGEIRADVKHMCIVSGRTHPYESLVFIIIRRVHRHNLQRDLSPGALPGQKNAPKGANADASHRSVLAVDDAEGEPILGEVFGVLVFHAGNGRTQIDGTRRLSGDFPY